MTTTLVELKYGYDQASNRLYRRDEVARTNSASFDELYAYDGLHRLTSFDRGQLNSGNDALSSGPTLTQDWTLDATGNWKGFTQTVQNALTQTRSHFPVNEIEAIAKTVGADWPTPAYDDNGNTTSFPQPGSLEDSYTAVYDPWNRLVKLTNDADNDKTVAEYEYDGLNRRTQKKVYDDGSLDYTRHYYHSDQWQVLEERVDSDTSADRQYVWGLRYVDDLVLRDHDSTRLYALTDALFNVVALTDDTGDVKERFAYQPYGESKELDPDFDDYSGIDYEWEYRFTGRELDLESGLQLNRNRYLHQQLGRWITRDPIGYGGSMNVYEYTASAPSFFLDPHGLMEFHHWFMAYWKNLGKGQKMVDEKCPQMIGRFDIHDFTTEYTTQEHRWIHTKPTGEVSYTISLYQIMYEKLHKSSTNCCDFLLKMAGFILAWDAAVDYYNSQESHLRGGGTIGSNDPESHKPWNMVPHPHVKPNAAGSSLAKYDAFLAEACGCSGTQQDDTNKKINQYFDEYLEKIGGWHEWTGRHLNPLQLIIPAPAKIPISIPKPIAA